MARTTTRPKASKEKTLHTRTRRCPDCKKTVTVHGVKPLKNKCFLRWQGETTSDIAVSLPAKRGSWDVIADCTT